MKLSLHRPSLAHAFSVVSGVVPTRTPKEILRNVKLESSNEKTILTGTDQEVGIRFEIPGVEIETGGECLLPTQRVSSILREMTDERVVLDSTEDAVFLRGGGSEFRLSAEDPAEFPPVPEFEDANFHALNADALKELIRRTVFATDPESHRYALGGVLMELSDDNVTMVATDSRRLALVKSACRSEGSPESASKQPVIPAKALSLVERSLGNEDEEVRIALRQNDVLIQAGSATIYGRLVEGRFPKYRDVIPKESRVELDLMVGPFHSAVRQSMIVTNEETRGVDFTFGKGAITLKSVATDVGSSTIEVPVDYSGEDMAIMFEPKYMADFLKVLEPESVVKIALNSAESAATFNTDDGYTYVIMPLSRDR